MGGTKCCVPGCTSNYNPKDTYVTVFKFPTEEHRKKEWLQKIPRKDFIPSKSSVVCINHFADHFILRTIEATAKDGSTISCVRKTPKLSPQSYPSIFPNLPGYLSSKPSGSRKPPVNREELVDKRLANHIVEQEQNRTIS